MTKTSAIYTIAFLLISFTCIGLGSTPVLSQDTLFFYVSPTGNDDWTGQKPQKSEVSNEGPFATAHCAAEAVQNARFSGVKAPVVVQFAEGTYTLDRSWVVTEEMSGTATGKTIFRSATGAEVSIIGGMAVLQQHVQVTPDTLGGINPLIRDSLYYIDLDQLGITDPGNLEKRGFPRAEYSSPAELFLGYQPLTMARWPNEGWTWISGAAEGRFGGEFTYASRHVDQWLGVRPLWLHGFWARDWADSYELVNQIDTNTNVIRTFKPHGTYGYEKGQRFYALNLLQELDQPGEWYLDVERKFIVYWPPSDSAETGLLLSRLTTPILQVQQARYLSFEGLTFEVGRGHAVYLNESEHVEFSGCAFRNIGRRAVVIQGGRNNMIYSCRISATGEGGILASGGDRDSLVSAGHRIINNKIHHTNRWVITYSPGVQVEGVGIVISHNLFHTIPHMAIRMLGNEHVIEYNEFSDIGYETGDAGAIYIGKDWSMRGNVIRYNYFHDINSPYHRGLMGIYLDDLASGMLIHHNIFQNVQRAVVIGGGRNNQVTDNIFLSCRKSALRVEYRESTASNASAQLQKRLESVPYQSNIWQQKYPELSTLLEDDPLAPKDNLIQDNVVLKGKWIEIAPKASAMQQMKNNRLSQDFSQYKLDTDSLTSLFNHPKLQLPDIPWQEIGLQHQ